MNLFSFLKGKSVQIKALFGCTFSDSFDNFYELGTAFLAKVLRINLNYL